MKNSKVTEKTTLLEESIADANELRNAAMESAKQQLIEAFQPKIKSMISKVIENDELENEDEMPDVPVEDEELEEAGCKKKKMKEQDEELEDEDLLMDDEDEDIPIDLEDDEDEIPMEESDELDVPEDDEELDLNIEDDEDVDLELNDEDEDLALDEEDEIPVEDDEELDLDIEDDEEPVLDEEDEIPVDDEELDIPIENDEEEELEEAYKTIRTLKKKINEVKLLNWKLAYSNKIFNRFGLNKKQKVRIIESIDSAKDLNEVKLIYSTIVKNLQGSRKPSNIEKLGRLKESISRAKTSTTKSKKPIVTEGTENVLSRLQFLAGIRKNK